MRWDEEGRDLATESFRVLILQVCGQSAHVSSDYHLPAPFREQDGKVICMYNLIFFGGVCMGCNGYKC